MKHLKITRTSPVDQTQLGPPQHDLNLVIVARCRGPGWALNPRLTGYKYAHLSFGQREIPSIYWSLVGPYYNIYIYIIYKNIPELNIQAFSCSFLEITCLEGYSSSFRNLTMTMIKYAGRRISGT